MCQSHLLHTGRIQDWWDPRWPWPPNCPWAWPSGRCHCSSGVTPKRGAFSVLKFSHRWWPLPISRTTLPHGPAPDSGSQKGRCLPGRCSSCPSSPRLLSGLLFSLLASATFAFPPAADIATSPGNGQSQIQSHEPQPKQLRGNLRLPAELPRTLAG